MVEPQFQSQEKSSIDFQFIFCVSPVPKGKDLSQKKKKWHPKNIAKVFENEHMHSSSWTVCIYVHWQICLLYCNR